MSVLAEAHVVEGRLTLGSDLVVPWWSFTKTVLAAAALALVRDGRLTLDDEIAMRDHSLRQLLQHRAGLGDYGELRAYHEAVLRNEEPWPVRTLLERTEAGRLRYLPGEGWGYSNLGYLAVGRLIAATTGQDLEVALRTLVLDPLGIEGVRLARTRADLEGVTMGPAQAYHPGWVYHGLLVGPLEQAALLLDRLLGGKLLPQRLLAAMVNGHGVGEGMPGRPWIKPSYGLGLMIEGTLSHGPRGHTGGGPGSVIAVYRRTDTREPQTIAAFALGDDAGAVECAASAAL